MNRWFVIYHHPQPIYIQASELANPLIFFRPAFDEFVIGVPKLQ
jgi:hypothetical protein